MVTLRLARSTWDRYPELTSARIASARIERPASPLSRLMCAAMRSRITACWRNNFASSALDGGFSSDTRRAAAAMSGQTILKDVSTQYLTCLLSRNGRGAIGLCLAVCGFGYAESATFRPIGRKYQTLIGLCSKLCVDNPGLGSKLCVNRGWGCSQLCVTAASRSVDNRGHYSRFCVDNFVRHEVADSAQQRLATIG